MKPLPLSLDADTAAGAFPLFPPPLDLPIDSAAHPNKWADKIFGFVEVLLRVNKCQGG